MKILVLLYLYVTCTGCLEEKYYLNEVDPGKYPPHVEEDATGGVVTSQPFIDIFPPTWRPGDLYDGTDLPGISNALSDVDSAGDLLHDRRCAIGIANEGKSNLSNPRWAFYSGQIHSSMPFKVPAGKTGLSLFVKTKGFATGTVGVLSYDIEGTNHKVAVMWSVPFDFNIYDVWYNMKVYPKSVATDKNLWHHMYYEAGAWKTGGYESRTEFGVKMKATMTDNHKSKLIVWVNADSFDAKGDYNLCTDCKYHPGWIGHYCTQECFAKGWCWTSKKCSSRGDCNSRFTCHSKC